MLNWHEELIKLRRLEIEEDRQILLKRSLPAEKIIDSRKNKRIITMVGFSFLIYNGKKFIPIKISDEMVGHKLGEFSPTRTFRQHSGDRKA